MKRLIRVQRGTGSRPFRLAVGQVEFAHGKGIPLDVLMPPPYGSILSCTYRRDPDTMPDVVRRKVADGTATCHVLVSTRLLFFGVLKQNLVEWGVGRRAGVITWFKNDMRRIARGHPDPNRVWIDPFTSERRLCDDDGMVSLEPAAEQSDPPPPVPRTYLGQHNDLARLGGHPTVAEPFACTGSAHLAGEHIACTSPAHVTAAAIAPTDRAAYLDEPEPWERDCAP